MSASATACESSGWNLTNLQLQKLLYLAHMKFLAENDGPLISDNFEAWKYGPVVAKLYHKLKPFGDEPIGNVFFVKRNMDLKNHRLIKQVVKKFAGKKPFELVELTHRPGGAWDRYYDPDISGLVIPDRAIKREFMEHPF